MDNQPMQFQQGDRQIDQRTGAYLMRSQFNVTPIEFHTHNGIDSPRIDKNNMNIPLYTALPSIPSKGSIVTGQIIGVVDTLSGTPTYFHLYVNVNGSWIHAS